MNLFDPSLEASDEMFKALRDLDHLRFPRHLVSEMWQDYSPYAEAAFAGEMRAKFHQRFWEMYLAVALMKCGKVLRPDECRRQNAPDLCIEEGYLGRIWIEAIAPTQGDGPDAVPLSPLNKGYYIAEEKIILRLTSAIAIKRDKLEKHTVAGRVRENEPCIIAVNGWLIPESDSHHYVPYIVKSVLPIGQRFAKLSGEPLTLVEAGYKYRRLVKKAKGEPIPTDSFFNPMYSSLSGVLFSRASAFYPQPSFGSDFIFVHNPEAMMSLPKGWLKCGTEFWVNAKGELKSKRWARREKGRRPTKGLKRTPEGAA